jgi:hypothetical protein
MRSRDVMNVPPLLLTEEKYSKTFSGGLWTRKRFSYMKKVLRRYSGVRKENFNPSSTDAVCASKATASAVKMLDVSDLVGSQSTATQPAVLATDAAKTAYREERAMFIVVHPVNQLGAERRPSPAPPRRENALFMLRTVRISFE